MLVWSQSLYNFYSEVTLFAVETIFVVIDISQIVPFILIQLLQIRLVNTTMHDYTINSYCCLHHYFTVCALQVISFIVLLIRLIIIDNRKIMAVFCFKLIQFFNTYTHYIFIIHKEKSYFITNTYYLHCQFYHIPAIIFTLK